MKRNEAMDLLREIQEIADIDVAHRLADDVLERKPHSCNILVRCLIVNLDLGRFVMKRSKMRWALVSLFPANINSSIRSGKATAGAFGSFR